MTARWTRRLGFAPLAAIALAALFAPVIAPNRPTEQFADRAYAPPMRIRLHDRAGWRAPFVYPQVLENRVMRQYRDDESRPTPLAWLSGGTIVSIPASAGPLLILGADALGRDVFSRVVEGAGLSLGVAALGTFGALMIGAIVGGFAGAHGGRLDRGLMLVADFLLVLPGAYLVLVLRRTLPLVLSVPAVFALVSALFALSAWPHVARGVRAIVAAERARDYADAARASGASLFRLLRHLLPATRGFLVVEILLLVPSLLVAEVTVSFFGLGFPAPTASWGTMLQDAWSASAMSDAPWLLAPAVALFVVVYSLHLAGGTRTEHALLAGAARDPAISFRS